jgi:hypothetical protein
VAAQVLLASLLLPAVGHVLLLLVVLWSIGTC